MTNLIELLAQFINFMTSSTDKKNSGPSIVIVTPDPTSVGELTTELTSAGYDVVMAKDSNRALNINALKPNSWKPSMFIVDLIIPGESGFVLTQQLLDKYNDGKVPVVLMSKTISPEDKAESITVGAIALLQKPLTLGILKEAIEKEKIRRLKTEIGEASFKIDYD